MTPPKPPKAPEKLPKVTLLTLVSDADEMHTVFLVQMQGDAVLRRKAISEGFLSKNEAMDEYNRLALRCFFFGEAEQLAEVA
jgi:hypothetical protein